jgi:hypothetical protein
MNMVITELEAPFEQSFLASAQSLNAFVTKGALLSYQHDVLTTGSFTCTCPFTGILRQPSAHFVLPGSGILYHFDGPERFILLAASLKDGFPILCMITADNVIWTSKKERANLIPLARRMLTTEPTTKVTHSLRPYITIGDPNFAHFIWNEFPALFEAVQHTRNFDINLRFDPLGITEGFARQTGSTVSQDATAFQGKAWSRRPTVCLGSTFCNASAKNAAMALMGLPARCISKPRLWITIRDQGRTMENQTAFLSALITTQTARAPDTEFLIDGFSTPMDMNRSIYDALHSKFAARIKGAQKIVSNLKSKHPNTHIRDMTGQPLNAALCAISTCSFYVSHAGTMQHKPAWFYPLNGLQRGNHASMSPAALRWSAQMVSGAKPPAGLDCDLIQDTDVSGLPIHNDRNKDYFVTDIPAAVRSVLDQMDANTAMI